MRHGLKERWTFSRSFLNWITFGKWRPLLLPDLEEIRSRLQGYVDSLGPYRKNRFPELPSDVRPRVAQAWEQAFQEWSYPA